MTGGGGGIGRHVCRLLAEKGHRVFAANRRFSDAFRQEVSGLDVIPVATDFADTNSVAALLAELDRDGADIVGTVLLASPAPNLGLLAQLPLIDLENQLSVSVVGHHQLLAALIERQWKQRARGAVLGVLTSALSEDSAEPTSANMGGYIVAKAALRALLQCYRKDYPWLQIALVSPGFTRTDMLTAFDDRYVELLDEQNKIDEPDVIAIQIVAVFGAELNRHS